LLTKLVERVTVELEKNPVSTKTVNAEDSKTTPSKKKKAKKSEPPTPSVEDKTPSKKKKATDEVAPMDVQIEETSSKKKQQQKSAKKVKVSKDSP
jgi:hypothetical protein